jgi:tetrahydromethanopterin S-methyltransferase subunit G
MVEIQERVAKVEGRVEEHARMLTDIAGAIRHLEVRMDQRFTSMDLRFTALEGRLTALDQKLDQKVGTLDQKIGTLDEKIDSHFRWLVGIQFAMLIAIIASFVAG